MPRKAAVEIDTIFDVIKDYPIFDETTGLLNEERRPVWNEIVKNEAVALKNIARHNLHQKVYNNTKNIQTRLRQHQKKTISASKKTKIKNDVEVPKYDIQRELIELKFSEKYKDVIHQVTSYPFSVSYWYPEQVKLGKDMAQYTDYQTFIFIFQDVIYRNDPERESTMDKLCLVILCAIDVKNIYPFYQTISKEAFNQNFVKKFLREIIKSKFPLPAKICLPFAYVFVNSLSLVFNKCSFEEYLHRVFNQLKHGVSDEVESEINTIIIIDFAQFFLVISRQEFETEAARKFFLFCVIYLATLPDLERFELAVVDLFTLLNSTFQTDMTKKIKQNFISKFTPDITCFYEQMSTFSEDSRSVYGFLREEQLGDWKIDCQHELSIYVEALEARAHEKAKAQKNLPLFNHPNGHFSSKISKFFLYILKIFPFWIQAVPLSSSDTSFFAINYVRKIFPQQELVFDDIFQKHLIFLSKQIDRGRGVIEKLRHKKLPKSDINVSDHSYLSHQENWMGKNDCGESNDFDETGNEQLQIFDRKDSLHHEYDYVHRDSFSSLEKSDLDETFDQNKSHFYSTPIKNHPEEYQASSTKENSPYKPNKKQKLSREKKGQYVSQFAALRAHYSMKAKKKLKMDVQIRSACKFAAKTVDGSKYSIHESSVFDSLAEIFSFMCRNFKSFEMFCKNIECTSQQCFFLAIFDFCKNGKVQTIYKHRAIILKHCGTVTDSHIDINEPPGKFLSTMLNENIENHFILYRNISCSNCNLQYKEYIANLEIKDQSFHVTKLNEYLESFIKVKACQICSHENISLLDCQVGEFLSINLEHYEFETFLNVVPECLDVSDKIKFLLTGAITSKKQKDGKKHYTAFCRSSDGQWYKRDNTEKVKQGCIKSYPRVTLSVIFYILYNDAPKS